MVTSQDTAPVCDPWTSLPPHLKVLYIGPAVGHGRWLADAFSQDSAAEVVLEEAPGATPGLARLRDEAFDAVFVAHQPGSLDGLQLVEGLRVSGSDDPVIVLGNEDPQQLTAVCYEVGADDYCHVPSVTTRALIWMLARAVQRHQLMRENRRLVLAERQRLRHEHQETERLLRQQRSLIEDLETLCDGTRPARDQTPAVKKIGLGVADDPQLPILAGPLSERLARHYGELLRAYVIMGTGNLSEEMSALVDLLASAGVTARQTMQLHVHVLEQLIEGLGNRSARHVMNRADLLVLEVMVHLAEGYRQHYLDHMHPPRQSTLPGFE